MNAAWFQRMRQHRVWIRVILGLLLVIAVLAVAGPQVARAEGTVDLYENYATAAECPLGGVTATAGPNYPGTGADVSGVGTLAWTNPGNIVSNNNSNATAAISQNVITHYLSATDFNFSIPSGATILGIQVDIGRYSSDTSTPRVRDSDLYLLKGGTVTGTDHAATSTDWPATETNATYGGSADLWGTTWTPAEINNANFGVVLSATNTNSNSRTANVDYIRVTITYQMGNCPRALIEWRNNVWGKDDITGPTGWDHPRATLEDGMAYRRTFFRVYAFEGERILMGSSAMFNDMNSNATECQNLPDLQGSQYGDSYDSDTTNGDCASDIVVYTEAQINGLTWGPQAAPQDIVALTPAFSCRHASTANGGRGNWVTDSQRGVLIYTTQETNGPVTDPLPNATTWNANYYNPCAYTVPTGGTGIYYVAFYGVGGSVSTDSGVTPHISYDARRCSDPSNCPTGTNPPAGQRGAGGISDPVVTGACATAGSCYNGNQTWQLNGVSMMDITVRTAAGANQTGRVWTSYLSQYIGQNGDTYSIFERFLTTTADGFTYQVDTNGLDGNGWTFYGSRQGFLYPDGVTTLYHDAVNPTSGTYRDTMYLNNPAGGVLMQRANAEIWFNTPTVPTSIVPTPTVPAISDPDFNGTYGLWEDGIPTSYFETGGTFGFTTNVVGQATIIIVPNPGANAAACAGAVYDGGLTTNRTLSVNVTTPGANTFTWDGKDNAGNWFATSYPDNDATPGYCYQVSLRAGEYHFPMFDIESSTRGGPILTLLPPPSTSCPFTNCRWAFYDDRTYVTSGGNVIPDLFNGGSFAANTLLPCGYDNYDGGTCSGTKPSPSHTSVTGYDTATNARQFGGNYSDDHPWGNQKALDLWTYWPSNLIYGLLYIVPTSTSNTAAIGNYVWLDEDGDGDQDAGEAGIPNVKVTITNGTRTYTTYTDANGGYLFTGLSAGTWTVTVDSNTLPTGLNQTYDENGVGTPHTTPVVLAIGQEYLTADFGYNWSTTTETNTPASSSTGAIGDRVWVDVDGDGKQDAEEVGVEGVTVQLTRPGADGILGTADDTTATTTTDANGNYIFDGLAAGAYTVTVTDTNNKLSGYTQTGDPDHFATTGTNDNKTTTPIVLGPGDVFVNADFGYQPTTAAVGSIGDTVWFDADADGCGPQIGGVIQGRSTCTVADASEYGIPGVTVALIKDDGDGVYEPGIDKIIATDITDANGQYLFAGLPVTDGTGTDDYLVWVNDTENVLGELVQSYDNNGTLSPNVSAALNLTTAGNLRQDFGYTARGQNTGEGMIGDYVYFDRNGDGVYDADGVDNVLGTGDDENGIEGVIVELRNSTGTLIATTRTDENGYYSFGNLAAGSYTVRITNTANFGTSGNASSMGALYGMTYSDDPDATVDGISATVTLSAGSMINLNQDFGVEASGTAGSIGNLVWNDVNADGNVDTGEAGIAGVTVDLYRDLDGDGKIDPGEPRVGTAITDDNGAYSFTGLSTVDNGLGATGADYIVDVTDNAGVLMGYWQSYGTTGTNDNSQVDPYAVSITSGAPNNVTADFGYYVLPGAVGNVVWEDLNANGIQDGAEPGIPGVEVTLTITWPNSGTPVTTVLKTTTAADGSYSFGNLLLDEDYNGAGSGEPTFTISVATPAGYVSTYDGTPDATGIGNGTDANADNEAGEVGYPPEGGVDNTNDFGFFRSGSIGNYVWLDEDGDGDQDAGEAGIPNVKVTVTNGTQTYTTYTDANGGYLFTGLRPGNWTVTVDETTLPAGLAANNTYNEDTGTTNPDNVTTVNLSAGEEHLTADFGYNWSSTDETNDPDAGENATGAIGDRVWVDADGDGVQDTQEIGVAGVTVDLYYDSDNDGYADDFYGSTTTDVSGNYVFDNLPKGIYEVRIPSTNYDEPTDPLYGYTQTGDPDHFAITDTSTGANDNKTTVPILLGPGDVFVNADFGYQPAAGATGSIGDTVWFDPDGDAVVDAGEYGIPGVTVSLIKDDGDGVYEPGIDKIIATDITDANGNYLFSGLPLTDGVGTDDYLVWVNDTNHVLGELAPVYDKDGVSSPNISAVLNLGTTGSSPYGTNTVTDQDFGYAPRGHTATEGLIGDTVWLDANGDGVQDAGEGGLEGVTVRLYNSTGTILLATTVTDENGHYTFGNLPVSAGGVTYQVQVVPPAGLTQTYDFDGLGTANASTVTLTTTTPIKLDQDFGYRGLNTIEGTIWEDADADGYMDGGEGDYFAGVTVVLYNSAGNIVATTTTDEDGFYEFTGLPDGTYTVDVTDDANVLNGYWKSLGDQSVSVDDTSKADPYTLSVAGGQTIDTVDFGYYVDPAAVGNWVWNDANQNGIQDGGEAGIPNVEVVLTILWPDNTTTVVKTTTVAGGYYSFGNLLLDEDYQASGGAGQPAFTITVDKDQIALSGLYPTEVDDPDATDGTDADDYTGVPALVAKGELDETYDFGFQESLLGVVLDSFSAATEEDGVLITWETASEQETAGFNLYRAEAAAGPWVQLNETLIAAQAPGLSEGRSYTWTDAPAAAGTYWYMLEDVALDGAATRHDPVSVTLAGPNAVGLAGFSAIPATLPSLAGLAALALAALAGAGMRGRRRK